MLRQTFNWLSRGKERWWYLKWIPTQTLTLQPAPPSPVLSSSANHSDSTPKQSHNHPQPQQQLTTSDQKITASTSTAINAVRSSVLSLTATITTEHGLDSLSGANHGGSGGQNVIYGSHTSFGRSLASRSVSNLLLDQDQIIGDNGSSAEIIMTLKWDKLSPAEFEQLQDYIQCKCSNISSSSFFCLLSSWTVLEPISTLYFLPCS